MISSRLNTSIAADDAPSIDIKYHKNCWAIHVSHVLRKETYESPSEKLAGGIAAQTEFLTMTEMNLRSGKVATMSKYYNMLFKAYYNLTMWKIRGADERP